MSDGKDERQSDPRGLSEKTPGRSKNQDEAPQLPSPALTEKKQRDEKARVVTPPPATEEDLERREARGRGAMPFGTKGSLKGRPAGGSETPEDRAHRS